MSGAAGAHAVWCGAALRLPTWFLRETCRKDATRYESPVSRPSPKAVIRKGARVSHRSIGVDERMSPAKAFPLGLQHFLSMFGATVLVPLLMGFSPSVSVMCSGIGTALYLLTTHNKIPSYLGPSFSFIGPVVLASATAGTEGVCSAIAVAGLIFIVCALVIRAIGTDWINTLIPTVVMASIIFVIGCGLSTTAVQEAFLTDGVASAWPALVVSGTAFIVVVLCTCFGKRVLNTIPVLVGAAVAYAVACAFGVVDFSPVREAAWLGLPDVSLPTFNLQAILLVSPIALVVVIEHIGHLFVIGEMTGNNYNSILWRSVLGDGLATTVAGFLGAPPATTFAENIGVMSVTRVYSTQVFWYAAATAFLVGGFCPKLGALIGTIPDTVIGGVSIVIFGLIACNALKMLVDHRVDMASMRNLTVFGGPAIIGIGMQALGVAIPLGSYNVPGLAVAALLGVFLNLVLPKENCS